MMDSKPYLSLVIPCYNEEENVPTLLQRVEASLVQTGKPFEAARGEVIATIDADLQNDPEEIPRLLPLLDEKQVDMITGWRKDRQDTGFRKWQSRQANRIRNW